MQFDSIKLKENGKTLGTIRVSSRKKYVDNGIQLTKIGYATSDICNNSNANIHKAMKVRKREIKKYLKRDNKTINKSLRYLRRTNRNSYILPIPSKRTKSDIKKLKSKLIEFGYIGSETVVNQHNSLEILLMFSMERLGDKIFLCDSKNNMEIRLTDFYNICLMTYETTYDRVGGDFNSLIITDDKIGVYNIILHPGLRDTITLCWLNKDRHDFNSMVASELMFDFSICKKNAQSKDQTYLICSNRVTKNIKNKHGGRR